ncbi:hypothetical protein FEM48_Zijuj01G0012100 [Ziziphus jujuba var. spinosa]|uniref:glucose-6-phosphate 1-epimerase n=1 Tax=Ziziphus jujuba var. spinosa TaxID=714518 RepID=A0A978VYA2_ZIZJJ|nr:hypothetical protein FEM48_Zijuj01G0012100 [Ziziphus jujuba var. spinosa]
MSGEKLPPQGVAAANTSGSASAVEFCKGVNGLEKVVLREPRGTSAEVYLYGGHVTSWKNDHGEELLFVSSKAIFKPPKAIRGGIPICFPQFGGLGSLEQHGFARNRFWIVDTDPPPFPVPTSSRAYVDLLLKPSEEDLKIWPHSYEFRLRVALSPGGDLMLTSRIRNTNTDGKAFSFTFAYHTYFSVSDISSKIADLHGDSGTLFRDNFSACCLKPEFYAIIEDGPESPLYDFFEKKRILNNLAWLDLSSEVRVEGLETLDYLDNLQNRERFTEQGDAITFESEVDKIYLSTPTKIAILDHEKKRTFVMRKEGLPDAVVWNPWDKKAKAMADFGDDEYKHMLCVEAAAIEKSITLKPGEEWKGRQELSAVPSSYCSGQLDPHKVLQGS